MAQSQSTMKACVSQMDASVLLTRVDIPEPGPNQVRVKIVAAAQNPPDYMVLEGLPSSGIVVGHDFAGTVERLGSDVPPDSRRLGERVAGFVNGGLSVERSGTFAEYCLADSRVLLTLPDDISFEDASTLGMAGFTAAQAMWEIEAHLPWPNEGIASKCIPILIWGGASSVGQLAIQLASAAGMDVYTTASPRNHSLLRSLGASHVFEYRDPEVCAQICSQVKFKNAVDCISTAETVAKVSECLQPGGYIALVLPQSLPPGVKGDFSLVFTLLGKEVIYPITIPASTASYEFGCRTAAMMSHLLAQGKLRGVPTKIVDGGLRDVNTWLKWQKDGKVSAEKVVFRIADTPDV